MADYNNVGRGDKFQVTIFTVPDGSESCVVEGIRLENKDRFKKIRENAWAKSEKCLFFKDNEYQHGSIDTGFMLAPNGELVRLPILVNMPKNPPNNGVPNEGDSY